MTSFHEIQQRTLTLDCPEWGTCSMEVALRCDRLARKCILEVVCHACGDIRSTF